MEFNAFVLIAKILCGLPKRKGLIIIRNYEASDITCKAYKAKIGKCVDKKKAV